MMHEGGYGITSVTAGSFEFSRPDGTLITNPPVAVPAGDEILRRANTQGGVNPDQETQTHDWDGSRPKYPLIIENLLYADGHLDIGSSGAAGNGLSAKGSDSAESHRPRTDGPPLRSPAEMRDAEIEAWALRVLDHASAGRQSETPESR